MTTAKALYADRYSLSAPYSMWRNDQDDLVSYELFVRSMPGERGYMVAAGLADLLRFLSRWRFTKRDLNHARRQGIRDEGFLDYLSQLRFTGSVHAMPEGTLFYPGEPVIRIQAPRIQATILEASILGIINPQSMVASKAGRIVTAAQGRPVWEQGMRRAHGLAATPEIARAAFIGGCAGTSNMEAGAQYKDIPTAGTMMHAFVMMFGEDNEQLAFEQYFRDFPEGTTALIDTYDVLRGARRAITAAEKVKAEFAVRNQPWSGFAAVRIDTNTILEDTLAVRQILDEAGWGHVKIAVSNDLDEYEIEALLSAGAPIDSFGVGTRLATVSDHPYISGVYKLTHQNMHVRPARPEFVMKKAKGKSSDPGNHQVFRQADCDVIALANELLPGQQLLRTYMKMGRMVEKLPRLPQIQRYVAEQIAALPPEQRRLREPEARRVERSDKLMALRARLGDPDALELLARPVAPQPERELEMVA